MNFCWVPRSITFHSVTCFPHLKNGPVSDLLGVSVSYPLREGAALVIHFPFRMYSFFGFAKPAIREPGLI